MSSKKYILRTDDPPKSICYDPDVGIATVTYSNRKYSHSEEINDHVIMHLDHTNRLIEVEILGVDSFSIQQIHRKINRYGVKMEQLAKAKIVAA